MYEVHASLAALPGKGFIDAMQIATGEGIVDPLLGRLGTRHVQLCPQNFGWLNDQVMDTLMAAWPDTRFRIHANCRVLEMRLIKELDTFDAEDPWWKAAAAASKRLGSHGYTAHAGRRATGVTLQRVFDNAKRASDLMGTRVGIEGGYPTPKGDPWLLSSWEEYGAMLEAEADYALDLSHLNIVRHLSGDPPDGLVEALLASPHCMEVHLSANSGSADQHKMLKEPPWWWSILQHIHPDAIVFSEGAA